MRALISLFAAYATFAAAPAFADVYKWVDENGKTHYSDQAPKKGAKIRPIGDRLSLYTPEPGVAYALRAAPTRNPTALADRVASLERQLQAERLAKQSAALERCLADRRTDCDQLFGGGTPYPPVVDRPADSAAPSRT